MEDKIQNQLTDLKGNPAILHLQNLQKEGKINFETFETLKTRFQRLHDGIVKSNQNLIELPNKVGILIAEINQKKQENKIAQQKSDEIENQAKKAQSLVKKAEEEEENQRKQCEQMMLEAERKQQELNEEETKIAEMENQVRQKIQQEKNVLHQQTEKLNSELNKAREFNSKQVPLINEFNTKIKQLEEENIQLISEIEKLRLEESQTKDEPEKLQKKYDQLLNEKIMTEKNDLQKVLDDNAKTQKQILQVRQQCEQQQKQQIESQKIYDDLEKEIKSIKAKSVEYGAENIQLNQQFESKQQENLQQQQKDNQIKKELEKTNYEEKSIKKDIEHQKMLYKKIEKETKNLITQTNLFRISISKYEIEEKEIKSEIDKLQSSLNNVEDESKLTEHKRRQVDAKIQDKQAEKEKINNQIKELEQQLKSREEFEASALKKVKRLTAMRESMARKASQAMNEVRETRQQLKIKELAIKDLEKKYQEIKFERNNCKILYEAVKSERNKYVNYIQSTQQDLAEVKEQNKISQNELEIFKNEYQEKHQNLIQYQHTLQIQKHQRDGAQAELNAQEYIRKAKKELVDRNINEIEKLNMIIRSLENECLSLKKQYERSQEWRNYTGVQLIDRNDELCIMYEKSNNQENALQNGEMEIKNLEDNIRMIKISIKENNRKIDVCRKQIQEVPKLADEVVNLQKEYQKQQQIEAELSEKLENPLNIYRYRDLGGEDPDQEALDTKIGVLEERLNNKKEQLLEKELILDEITNFSEKLRKQALDGRQNTLELSEKLNNFQQKLKDITKKMMASISELSIFQANQIKLQQEREDIVKQLEEMKKRVDEGLPPTVECEIEYQNMLKYALRYKEERQLRLQKENLEKNFPPFATKTTAEHRVIAYIPDDTGIPKNYGKNAPFHPSVLGANIRHFRKPIIKDIEI